MSLTAMMINLDVASGSSINKLPAELFLNIFDIYAANSGLDQEHLSANMEEFAETEAQVILTPAYILTSVCIHWRDIIRNAGDVTTSRYFANIRIRCKHRSLCNQTTIEEFICTLAASEAGQTPIRLFVHLMEISSSLALRDLFKSSFTSEYTRYRIASLDVNVSSRNRKDTCLALREVEFPSIRSIQFRECKVNDKRGAESMLWYPNNKGSPTSKLPEYYQKYIEIASEDTRRILEQTPFYGINMKYFINGATKQVFATEERLRQGPSWWHLN
ncbi:hypothetical protein M422DRAFT_41191 [Sphaerobolus stellatus SS14]|nr:hypothetical protein M422DRAFT_41191 [Sphaerobolus stellatus SS14]